MLKYLRLQLFRRKFYTQLQTLAAHMRKSRKDSARISKHEHQSSMIHNDEVLRGQIANARAKMELLHKYHIQHTCFIERLNKMTRAILGNLQ